MPFRADLAGQALPERTIVVTPRKALAYAAAIDERGDVCSDDSRPDFCAPPYFCTALEWRTAAAGRAENFGLAPDELRRGVHVGQSTHFRAPIRPGMTVLVRGKILGLRATRPGALVQVRLETCDATTGRPLSTTLSSSLYRDVGISGIGDPELDAVEAEPAWAPPQKWHEAKIRLDRWFAHRYTECADIWNPIHTERREALSAGLKTTIVHGTALWALAGREIVSHYAAGDPQRLAFLSARFAAMVPPDSEIVIRHGALENGSEIAFVVTNEAGEGALTRGRATLGARA